MDGRRGGEPYREIGIRVAYTDQLQISVTSNFLIFHIAGNNSGIAEKFSFFFFLFICSFVFSLSFGKETRLETIAARDTRTALVVI